MINAVLLLVMLFAGAFGLAVWMSPRALVYYGQRLVARAAALEAARRAYAAAWAEHVGPEKEATDAR